MKEGLGEFEMKMLKDKIKALEKIARKQNRKRKKKNE